MPDVHSIFSPSAAGRWMTCLGSVPLSADLPDSTSSYAAEGTAAHTVCENSLMMGVPASTFLGQRVDDFEVTQEMADGCQVFVDFVNEKAEQFPDTEYDLEQRIVSDKDDRFGGTIDCVMRNESRSAMAIVDFKYGAGIPVEAVGNKQLLCYALLAWRGEKYIAMAIVQPRCKHSEGPIRTWSIESDELMKFAEELWASVEAIDNLGDELPLVTGDHCRWCKALPHCPQQYKENLEEAMNDFAPVPDLTEDQRVLVMNRAGQIKAYLKAVEESLSADLLAGKPVKGYKLVQAIGNRQWSLSEGDLFKKLRSKKIKKVDSTVAKLKSPAQMEKVAGLDPEWVNQFTERPVSGPKMVPESDKRDAYIPPSPQDDFEPIERTEAEIEKDVVPVVPDFMM